MEKLVEKVGDWKIEDIEALVDDIVAHESIVNKDIFDILSYVCHDQDLRHKLEQWKTSDSPMLAEFFERLFFKVLGNKDSWWQQMLKVFKNHDIDHIDIGKVYQDAEEAIMEEKFNVGSELYSVIIWALASSTRPHAQDQLVKNPMHVCAFLESFESESKTIKLASPIILKNNLENEEISEEFAKKIIPDKVQVEFCKDCQSNVDQFPSFLYFKCLLKISECIENEVEAIEKRQFLMKWMKNYNFKNVKGFFYYQEHETFQELLSKNLEQNCDIKSTESLMNHLKEISQQLDFQSCFQPMTSDSLQDLEWILTELSDSKFDETKENFKITVDQNGVRKVLKPQMTFEVTDLFTATRMAKDQDKILVKSGVYDEFKNLCQRDQYVIKHSVSIFGQNETVIFESWLIKADSTFRGLKYNILGERKRIYISNAAKVRFEFCQFTCSVNTLIYAQNKSEIEFHGCTFDGGVVEGQQVSARVLSLDREDIKIKLSNCYVKNFHCFLAVIDPENVYKNIDIQIENCYFEDVQDGIVINASPLSLINVKIDKLKIELDYFDPELTSKAIDITSGGNTVARNIVIEATHADFTGLSFKYLSKVKLENIYICGNPELIEETSIGKGICIQNVTSASVQNCFLTNLRIAVEVISTSILKLVSIDAEKCSIGIFVQYASDDLKLAVTDINMKTCYYGLFLDVLSPSYSFFAQLRFQDVPKPLIAQKAIKNKLKFLTQNFYHFPSLKANPDELKEDQLETELRHPLYVHFCSKEKIPYRVAYEHDDFFIISRSIDE